MNVPENLVRNPQRRSVIREFKTRVTEETPDSNLSSLHIYCRDHEELSYGRNPRPAPKIAMPRRHRALSKRRHTNGGQRKRLLTAEPRNGLSPTHFPRSEARKKYPPDKDTPRGRQARI